MRRRAVLLLAAIVTAIPGFAQSKPKRVGFLGAGSAQGSDGPWLAAFRIGMREHGWSEGRDYVLETRFAEGLPQHLPRLAGELIAGRPDVILTPSEGTLAALLAKSTSVPMVFAQAGDPVRLGFVKSLQRPGGNVTGLTSFAADLAAKRVQLVKVAFPGVTHIGILCEPAWSAAATQVKETEDAAAALGIRTSRIEVKVVADVESLAQRGNAAGANAYMNTTSPILRNHIAAVVRQLAQTGKPAIFTTPDSALAGGLMSYGVSSEDNFRRAALYVDKILKGAKPADLPIEQPTKYELIVNLKTAKALGLAIPQSILVRADRIIE